MLRRSELWTIPSRKYVSSYEELPITVDVSHLLDLDGGETPDPGDLDTVLIDITSGVEYAESLDGPPQASTVYITQNVKDLPAGRRLRLTYVFGIQPGGTKRRSVSVELIVEH